MLPINSSLAASVSSVSSAASLSNDILVNEPCMHTQCSQASPGHQRALTSSYVSGAKPCLPYRIDYLINPARETVALPAVQTKNKRYMRLHTYTHIPTFTTHHANSHTHPPHFSCLVVTLLCPLMEVDHEYFAFNTLYQCSKNDLKLCREPSHMLPEFDSLHGDKCRCS